jgi:RNA polymerase sigma-70 factor, ECF subfamily
VPLVASRSYDVSVRKKTDRDPPLAPFLLGLTSQGAAIAEIQEQPPSPLVSDPVSDTSFSSNAFDFHDGPGQGLAAEDAPAFEPPASLVSTPVGGDESSRALDLDAEGQGRMRRMVDEHFDFVWRTLRRLGVSAEAVDDGAQNVFCTAARKLACIAPGSEKAYLFGTAFRWASDARKSQQRRRDREATLETESIGSPLPSIDELVDLKRARAMLDHVLDGLSPELRTVLMLSEEEGMTAPELSALLGVPIGTVASRLRRAREAFDALVRRIQIRTGGGVRR